MMLRLRLALARRWLAVIDRGATWLFQRSIAAYVRVRRLEARLGEPRVRRRDP